MRTLKKTLSLVLVVAMVLGLCVVGASAYNKVEDFTDDVDKIGDAYYEAVGVLTGIQVIDGMTETSFQPQGNYTREQAAKIIAYMMLGKADADSLRCTKAPFDDVAADRWSAGYIAFCVEQGIIDGMTETTFEPTGTLTGFQWAKMLLCAVGFGVKGEFTGSSWSLNTSKYAHNVDLFAGDLAGADHTAITREQAALYAFNVLTAVDLVVYSESLGDYIKGYNSWFVDRYTPQGTLAETVFKLYNTTGVVVNNEAMGNATTDIAASYTTAAIAKVKAGTGLDMMYHGVKVWFTGTAATKTAAASGTAVFVTDLAKVTEYCCYDIAAGMLAADKLSPKAELDIGTGTAYEFDVIDNSAVGQGTATVTTKAYLATLGYASTVNKTTFIGSENVKNDYIKTDISGITSTVTPNVVIKASEKAYHVFAPTATSGAVTKVTKEANGSYTMTLSDGTVLKESVLTHGDKQAAINDVIDILTGRDHITPTYYFLLDTHGHYMFLSEEYFRTVAYFTGVLKPVSDWNSWSNEVAYVAQFVDVADPTQVEEIPVTLAWANAALNLINTSTGRSDIMWYYDITDELYGDARYSPEPVFEDDYLYGTKYMYSDGVGFDIYDETRHAVDVWFGNSVQGSYRYDPDTIVFNIAYGAGSSLEIETYVGVDALVKGYAEKHGVTIQSLDLMHVAMTYQTTSVGNKEILSVFGFEDVNANGAFLFVPNTITWGSVADDYYTLANAAYINGSAELGTLKFEKGYFEDVLNKTVERGFYWYTVETRNGVSYTRLDRVKAQDMGYMPAFHIETAGTSNAWINGVPVASDCLFVDTRTGAGTLVDSVTDFVTFCKEGTHSTLQIAYMWIGNENKISVIYIVDENLGIADFSVSEGLGLKGWTVTSRAYEDGIVYLYNDEALEDIAVGTEVIVSGEYAHYAWTDAGKVSGDYTGTEDLVTSVVALGDKKAIKVDVSELVQPAIFDQLDVVIDSITYEVVITNKATDFAATGKYPVGGDATTNVPFEDNKCKLTVDVGESIQLCVYRSTVKDGISAKLNMTNAVDQPVTFGNDGYAWTNGFVAETNSVTIEAVTAEFTFSLGNKDKDAAKNFNFKNDANDANYDMVEFVGVPGDVETFYVQRSNKTISTGNEGRLLLLDTANSGTQKSVEAAKAAESSNQVFTFSFVLGQNNEVVTLAHWSDEVYPTA